MSGRRDRRAPPPPAPAAEEAHKLFRERLGDRGDAFDGALAEAARLYAKFAPPELAFRVDLGDGRAVAVILKPLGK
jgi:hypothetical protein